MSSACALRWTATTRRRPSCSRRRRGLARARLRRSVDGGARPQRATGRGRRQRHMVHRRRSRASRSPSPRRPWSRWGDLATRARPCGGFSMVGRHLLLCGRDLCGGPAHAVRVPARGPDPALLGGDGSQRHHGARRGAYLEMADAPMVDATRGLIAGTSVVFWAFATWLIPPLVAAGWWRHRIHRVPFRYEATLWSDSLPRSGMYAVAGILSRPGRPPADRGRHRRRRALGRLRGVGSHLRRHDPHVTRTVLLPPAERTGDTSPWSGRDYDGDCTEPRLRVQPRMAPLGETGPS